MESREKETYVETGRLDCSAPNQKSEVFYEEKHSG
jgi:hypothetical protein